MTVLRALLIGLLLVQSAHAETAADRFAPKRGLNFEIWNEWLTSDEMVTRPGFLDIYPDWRLHVPGEAVAKLAPMGFDFVRLPMDPAPLLRLGPGPAQDALIDQIHATALMVQATGVKVIVDMHSIPRPDEVWGTENIVSDPALFDAHVALVGKVAARLDGMDPQRTAFELLNEPTHDCDAIWNDGGPMQWPDQLVRLHRAARDGAPELPLVLSGACWGGVDGLSAINPANLKDDNLLWSFHNYDPFLFTHQAAGWTSGLNAFFADLPYPPAALDDATAARLLADAVVRAMVAGDPDATADALATELAAYRALPVDAVSAGLQAAAGWADRHAIPRHRLILGEFGSMREDMAGRRFAEIGRATFLRDKREAAEALGIGWAVWVWSGTFGVAEDDRSRVLAPETCAALALVQC
jgi:endoglucanase